MTDHVIRYVVTHMGKDGLRTLCGPAQGRLTKDTREEAQELLDNMMANNRMENGLLAGVYGPPLEVRAAKCYPGHFDPIGIYFDNDEADAPAKENSVTEILQHKISWFLRGKDAPAQMDECSIEHIETLIKEGFNQGELCVSDNESGQEFWGWWRIETDSNPERQRG